MFKLWFMLSSHINTIKKVRRGKIRYTSMECVSYFWIFGEISPSHAYPKSMWATSWFENRMCILTPVTLLHVLFCPSKHIAGVDFWVRAGLQHTPLLWNIQFGNGKEIALVNNSRRTHEIWVGDKVQSLWYRIRLQVLMGQNAGMPLPYDEGMN